ncbi:hypothetical protein LX64_05195 [Chitinophaga skermanii]|uniref:RNA polymerase sigma-70 factor (ECF subfamily) n=1 Tax=Chitinophaga skermanii TaxID=331697 RepID=A0A327PZ15_9BACT|nr:hypothetical protein [Chitinophaga skermanii]RAI96973.1 hypothetical protein LX64_05195 [Chitinophaga skermanii]
MSKVNPSELLPLDEGSFYDQYSQAVYGLILKNGVVEPKASDIMVDIFTTAHKQRHLYTGDYKVFSWLLRIAVKELAKHVELEKIIKSQEKGLNLKRLGY